jgi:hypothetical protein
MRLFVFCVVLLTVNTASASLIVTDQFDVLNPNWEVRKSSGGAYNLVAGGKLLVGGSGNQWSELLLKYNLPIARVGSVRIDYRWDFRTDHKARVGIGLFNKSITEMNHPSPKNGVLLKGVLYGRDSHAVDGRFNDAYHISYNIPTKGTFLIERDNDQFRASYFIDHPLRTPRWETLYEGSYEFTEDLYPYVFTSNSNNNPDWQVELDNFAVTAVPEPSSLMLGTVLSLLIAILVYNRRKRVCL